MVLYLRGTTLIYLSDRSRPSGRRSCGVTHTSLIAIKYLISDHDLDRLLIVIALLIAGHMVCSTLFRSRSLVVIHTNLIAITYLIADHDLDRLADRDYIPDRYSRS